MPRDGDFKRLVRARMRDTGERYTDARIALDGAHHAAGGASERIRSLLGQLADVEMAPAARRHLEQLPDEDRRAGALEGLQHESWRVRRASAQILDDIDLTTESIEALTKALDDQHPQVRRKAVHTLSCKHCKPSGCVVDVRALFERAVLDRSSLVRSMVVHACSLTYFGEQWAVDLVAAVAASDKSPKLRERAAHEIERLRRAWESDAARRQLAPELVRKSERHTGRWVAIRDGSIVAVSGQARVFTREVRGGATKYWVAPPDAVRPRLPLRSM